MDNDPVLEEIFNQASQEEVVSDSPPLAPRGRRFLVGKRFATALALGLLSSFACSDQHYNKGYFTRSVIDCAGFRRFVLETNTTQPTPFERYASLEDQILGEIHIPEKEISRHTKQALEAAQAISDNVAKSLLKTESGYNGYNAPEIAKTFPRQELMVIIANEIAAQGIFYHEESLLSRAFDPAIHDPGNSHLDCDLLTYLMMHVGQRLGVAMYAMQGPGHVYLFVPSAKDRGYLIEPTEFRRIEIQHSGVNFAGNGVGPGFFSTLEKQRVHGGKKASGELESHAGLHQPITNRQLLEDSMLANIIEGLMTCAKGDLPLQLKLQQKLISRANGTRSYLLATNAFGESARLALEYIKKDDLTAAEALVNDAVAMRKIHDSLIIVKDPIERTLQGLLSLKKGDPLRALAYLEAGNRFYEKRGYQNGMKPLSLTHADLLSVFAAARLEAGFNPLSIHDDIVVPGNNAYVQSNANHGFYFTLLQGTYAKLKEHPLIKAMQVLKDFEHSSGKSR